MPSYAASSARDRWPDTPPSTLVVTRDSALTEALRRLAAVAGAELEVRPDPPSLGRWAAPGLVIVGADLVAAVVARLPRRSGVVVVGLEPAPASAGDGGNAIWRAAVELGAERVTFLPGDEEHVVDALAEPADRRHRAAVVAVVAGSGGAGASVLATALAVTGSGRGRTLLADLDPLGGGLELLVGGEQLPGLRWPELGGARGRLGGDVLRDSLPRLDGLSVLSWGPDHPEPVPAEAAAAVADAARRGFDLAVLDLPRAVEQVPPVWLGTATMGLLVVRGTVRSVCAAARVLPALERSVPEVRLVVRGAGGHGLPADGVAAALDLPLLGELRPEPGLSAALDRGEPPGLRGRSPLARLSDRLLDELARAHGEAA
jgi:secretion/DNA translocation related CpaE-like protein